jgi:Ca2+-transporting ATPase
MNWHNLEIVRIYELLGTGPHGLKLNAAEERLLQTGHNVLQEFKKKSLISIIISQFKDTMILILSAAAIVSGLIGDFTDTITIIIIILINAGLGFAQEYKAGKAMQALKKMAVTQVTAVREGNRIWLSEDNLVPGDLVVLESGSAVPADLRIIECINLKVDEAALTGESDAAEKNAEVSERGGLSIDEKKNMVFKGTFVINGSCTGVVVATGMTTELGRIAEMIQEDEELTPLQQRMSLFAKRLSVIIFLICILFFLRGWLQGVNIVVMLLTSISLAVAAIPEALPAVITISLAVAAKRMIRLNCLIKKLPAVETLGSVTYICTDKTGTLTRNKMKVEEIYTVGHLFSKEELPATGNDKTIHLLLQAIALNNNAVADGNAIKGDSTEIALLELVNEKKIVIDKWPRIGEIAFDSKRKLMTTFHQHNDKVISFTKGAPEILIDLCKNPDTSALHSEVVNMGKKGYRVLGFAYRYWDSLPDKPTIDLHELDLHFLGLTGMIDPPREEVPSALAQCKTAGIAAVMITGDHPQTAETLARRIGIIEGEQDIIITGQELDALDKDAFGAIVERIKVYARASPEQKLLIVKMLQSKGHYVAMTGDGVNDAPSLNKANIGIAMGITGTDVSKAAADMILLDDNFSTIVKAVREGRRIYDNILKLIKYLMTTNSGELLILLLGPIVGLPIALLPIHILWINLVSDGLPALSLSYEKGEKNIMKRPPRAPHESVFANGGGRHMLWVGLLMAFIVLAAQAWAIRKGMPWQTIVFHVLSLSQMGHLLAVRSNHYFLYSGFFSNLRLIASVFVILLLQIVITYNPVLQRVFHLESLTFVEFVFVGVTSSFVFLAVEIEKAVFRGRIARKM